MPGTYGRAIQLLRKLAPDSKIVFRSHNADALHNLDKFKASWRPLWLRNAFRSWRSDKKVLRHVDHVDAISKYDLGHYWEPLATAEQVFKLRFLPFCYPDRLKSDYFKDYGEQAHSPQATTIVSFGSIGQKINLLNRSNVDQEISKMLREHFGPHELLLTGNPTDDSDDDSSPFKYVGYLDDPNELLASSDVLLDLSSLGHGFKTKYLDAALAGCRILVDKGYIMHLPLELYPFLVVRMKDDTLHEFSELSREALKEHAGIVNRNRLEVCGRLLQDLGSGAGKVVDVPPRTVELRKCSA